MANKNLTPRLNKLEKNIIIDGGMEIWPTGTSTTIGFTYGAVMFKNMLNVNVTVTNSRQTSVPANTGLNFSNQLSKTAAGTMQVATQANFRYHVEGYDIQPMMNKDYSLIFWVKSSVASNRSIALRNDTDSHSFVKQYNISQANQWELKVITIPALSSCPATLNKTNGAGLVIDFTCVAAPVYQTSTLGSWVAGLFLSGTGEDTTWITGTNHDFSITGVMLIPGDWSALTAVQYQFVRSEESLGAELSRSQRYYEKSYNLDINPGTANQSGTLGGITTSAFSQPTYHNQFKVSKRASPTITFWGPATGTSGNIDNLSGTGRSVATTFVGESGCRFAVNTGGATEAVMWHFTADARF